MLVQSVRRLEAAMPLDPLFVTTSIVHIYGQSVLL